MKYFSMIYQIKFRIQENSFQRSRTQQGQKKLQLFSKQSNRQGMGDKIDDFVICTKTTSLEHLKKYWMKALSIINKIEKQWEISFKEDPILGNTYYFGKIKNILSSYQILIVCIFSHFSEFNEYCQALQIQGLGKCMLKIFIQIISIVQVLIKKFAFKENETKNLASKSMIEQEKQNGIKKDEILQQREYWACKQRNKYEVNQIEQELERIQKSYEKNSKLLNYENVKRTREKAANIESSQAQVIIRQAFLLLESKQNALNDFLQLKYPKANKLNSINLKKETDLIHNEIEQFAQNKQNYATQKLMRIFQKYYNLRENEKKKMMKNIQVQTIQIKPIAQSGDHKRQVHRLKEQLQHRKREIKMLKQQLVSEKLKAEDIQKHLRQKTQNYQSELLKQKINLMNFQQRISIISKISSKPGSEGSEQGSLANFEVTDQNNQKIEQKKLVNLTNLDIVQEQSTNRVGQKGQKMKAIRQSNKSRSTNPSSYQSIVKKSVKFNHSIQYCYNLQLFQQVCQFHYIPESINHKEFLAEQKYHLDCSTQTQQINLIEKSLSSMGKCQLDCSFQQGAMMKDGEIRVVQDERTLREKQNAEDKEDVQLQISKAFDIYLQNQEKPRINELSVKRTKVMSFDKKALNNDILYKKRGIVNWSKKSYYNRNPYFDQRNSQLLGNGKLQRSLSKAQDSNFFSQNVSGFSLSKLSKQKDRMMKQQTRLQIKNKIPTFDSLLFNQNDLNNLFLKADKALGFEYLNTNAQNILSKYTNTEILKSQKSMKRSQRKKQKRRAQSCFEKDSRSSPLSGELIVSELYRHLKNLRQESHKKYEKIVKFLKFPYSSFLKHSKQEKQRPQFLHLEHELHLDACQLRKISCRLQNIHSNCQKIPGLNLCSHLVSFFEKIGLLFQTSKVDL